MLYYIVIYKLKSLGMELAFSFPKTKRLVYARLKAGKGSDPVTDARLKLRSLGIYHLNPMR